MTMPNDLHFLLKAVTIATKAHDGATYSTEPYIYHPLRVAYRCNTIEEATVAVLHDVVEDTSVSLADLQAVGFSDRVIVAIDSITRRSGETYREYIVRLSVNELATIVKLHDLHENMAWLPLAGRGDSSSMYQRYSWAVEQLTLAQSAVD